MHGVTQRLRAFIVEHTATRGSVGMYNNTHYTPSFTNHTPITSFSHILLKSHTFESFLRIWS